MLTSWNEHYATVNTPWSTNYGSFGTDYYYDPYASVVFDEDTGVWKNFNIYVLVTEWHDNTLANKGVLLWATNEDSIGYELRMRSSEYSDVNYRPYLEVTYTLPLSKLFYVKDHLGSTRAVIDSSGTVKESYDYYPFGLEMPGRIFVQGTVDTRNKFTGRERDGETNWDYFGARYYSAAIARWLAVDPLAEKYLSLSPFTYVNNNPLKYIDPNGKDIVVIIGKPYKDKNGENHPYGHMALRVINKNTDTVYDFGRYGRSWGIFDQYGEGILNVRKGDKYVYAENLIRESEGFYLKTTEKQDKAVIDFFESLTNSPDAKQLYLIDEKTGKRIKLDSVWPKSAKILLGRRL